MLRADDGHSAWGVRAASCPFAGPQLALAIAWPPWQWSRSMMKVVFNTPPGPAPGRAGCVRSLAVAASAGVGCVLTSTAMATPRPLPFTYTTETLAPGEVEIEEYADVTPVKAQNRATKNLDFYLATQFQTEFEIGIVERLELGLYIVYVPTPAGYDDPASLTETTGIKQRLRYIFADPGAWPIDVGLYGEVVEGDTEAEIEAKILLQRRFGKLRVASNLWAEYELYYTPGTTLALNPTLGATWELSPTAHVGAEGWMRVEFPNPAVHPREFSSGPVGYVGPTLMLDFGKAWWTVGIYGRVTDTNHTMEPGDAFGPVWGRTVIGLNL